MRTQFRIYDEDETIKYIFGEIRSEIQEDSTLKTTSSWTGRVVSSKLEQFSIHEDENFGFKVSGKLKPESYSVDIESFYYEPSYNSSILSTKSKLVGTLIDDIEVLVEKEDLYQLLVCNKGLVFASKEGKICLDDFEIRLEREIYSVSYKGTDIFVSDHRMILLDPKGHNNRVRTKFSPIGWDIDEIEVNVRNSETAIKDIISVLIGISLIHMTEKPELIKQILSIKPKDIHTTESNVFGEIINGNLTVESNGFLSFDVIENKVLDLYLLSESILSIYKVSAKEDSTYLITTNKTNLRFTVDSSDLSEAILYEILNQVVNSGVNCVIDAEEYSVAESILKRIKNLEHAGVVDNLTSADIYRSELRLESTDLVENFLSPIPLNFIVRHGSLISAVTTHVTKLENFEFKGGRVMWTFSGKESKGSIEFISNQYLSFLNNACVIMLGKLTKMGAVDQ